MVSGMLAAAMMVRCGSFVQNTLKEREGDKQLLVKSCLLLEIIKGHDLQ